MKRNFTRRAELSIRLPKTLSSKKTVWCGFQSSCARKCPNSAQWLGISLLLRMDISDWHGFMKPGWLIWDGAVNEVSWKQEELDCKKIFDTHEIFHFHFYFISMHLFHSLLPFLAFNFDIEERRSTSKPNPLRVGSHPRPWEGTPPFSLGQCNSITLLFI